MSFFSIFIILAINMLLSFVLLYASVQINCIRYMLHVAPHYKESYKQVAPPLLLISKRLQKCVSQKLKVKKEGAKLDNLPMGRRINVRNAFRGDGKIFYKRKLPDDSMDIAILLLIPLPICAA